MEVIRLLEKEEIKNNLDEIIASLIMVDPSLTFNEYRYELLENPVSKFLVLIKDNEIISYLDYWETFDSSTIFKIGTKKEERNKGYATLILQESFKLLKQSECLYMTLEVRESNESAKKLYLKNGFKVITKKEHYYKDGENALYMVKGLYE